MPETTYNKILDAAVAIFSERGYSGTSMREIAEALNVTKAALYYHFPGKAEIFSACLSRSLDQMVADLEKLAAGDLPFREKLEQMIAGMYNFSSVHPHTFRLFKMIVSQSFDLENSKRILHNYFNRLQNAVREMVQKGVKNGELRSDIPVDLLASAITGMLHHTTGPKMKHLTSSRLKTDEHVKYLIQLIQGGFASS
ncbi:MAG: TetR/AcrR family transcriptional regulator [Candidatus Neomarinimicrobiota bacterium]|jgi:AcrR family transcriptional regulator|nr:TetR/AcrR family transcriptional regulator [Candidatus Neomarinimicrobiota bacterium]MDD3965995.1 TetR/AcrR family transcriptional regulator [Candidatus Neomarinimicrobiota bacterium]MDX9779863.1 TetR/AcrR family transcriptional regulator [bacterium]